MYLKIRMIIPNYTAYNKCFCSTLFEIKYLFNLVKDKELSGQYPPVVNLALALVWCGIALAFYWRFCWHTLSGRWTSYAQCCCQCLHYCYTVPALLQGNFQHPQSQWFSVEFLCMRLYITVLIVLHNCASCSGRFAFRVFLFFFSTNSWFSVMAAWVGAGCGGQACGWGAGRAGSWLGCR